MKSTVAYLRVSTQDQSLERQYKDIKTFSKSKGLTIDKIFEDKISGSKKSFEERTGFPAMEKYLEQNPDIKNIVVLELSRLGRRNLEIQNLIHKYVEKGVNIHMKDLGVSTLDDSGEMHFATKIILSTLGLVAENEARQLSARIISGKNAAAAAGRTFSSSKIIGYKKGSDGTPEIDEEQAPMIRRIFELSSKSMGARIISDMIKDEFDIKLQPGTINGIIRNSFHKGIRKYKELEIPVPAIVSKKLWQKANDSIDNRKKYASSHNVNTNIVQGKILCSECGNLMHQIVNPKGRHNIYRCKNNECRNTVNRPWLYEVIRQSIERYSKRSRDEKVKNELQLKISSNEATIKTNENEIKKLERRKVKMRESYHDDDDYTKEEYNFDKAKIVKLTDKFNQENTRLEKQIKSFEAALKSDFEHFSKDLETFKNEIKDILHEVQVSKEDVIINIGGFRKNIVKKPSGAKLGWITRKIQKGEDAKIYQLPIKEISDEQLEMMKDNYLYEINSKN